jgi:hypothetical protein
VPFLPLDPGSVMGKKSRSGSGMNIPRAWKQFFGLKILKFFDSAGIRDPECFWPGIRDGKIRIRDPGYTSRIRNTGFNPGFWSQGSSLPVQYQLSGHILAKTRILSWFRCRISVGWRWRQPIRAANHSAGSPLLTVSLAPVNHL